MKTHTTLDGTTVTLYFDAQERIFLTSLQTDAKSMERDEYYNHWIKSVLAFYRKRGLSKRDIVETGVYRIAQDLHSRKMVADGIARVPDYRDDLEKIVTKQFPTRRAFCEATGLSEDMLSHVFAKRKHLAVDTLEEALAKVGYRLHIVPSAKAS